MISIFQYNFFKPDLLETAFPWIHALKIKYLRSRIRYSVQCDVILKLWMSSIWISNNIKLFNFLEEPAFGMLHHICCFPTLPPGLARGPGQQVWPTGRLPDLTWPILDRTNPVCAGHSSAHQVCSLTTGRFTLTHLFRDTSGLWLCVSDPS